MSAEEPQTEREWLMRIDGKVDQLLTGQQDHESRIRKVEGRQFRWMGRDGAIASGFGIAGGSIIAWLLSLR